MALVDEDLFCKQPRRKFEVTEEGKMHFSDRALDWGPTKSAHKYAIGYIGMFVANENNGAGTVCGWAYSGRIAAYSAIAPGCYLWEFPNMHNGLINPVVKHLPDFVWVHENQIINKPMDTEQQTAISEADQEALARTARDEQEYHDWCASKGSDLHDLVETQALQEEFLKNLTAEEFRWTEEVERVSAIRNQVSRRRRLIEDLLQTLEVKKRKIKHDLGI